MDTLAYFDDLDKNSEEFICILTGCTEEELKHQEENKWSILGIAEHILLTEQLVHKLLFRPTTKKSEKEEVFGAEKLNKLIVHLRARKVKAPDGLHPKGMITSTEEFKTAFLQLRNTLKSGIREQKIIIDNSVYAHPYLGDMTIRDWLYFIPAHTNRHAAQIQDILQKIRTSTV